MSGDSLSGGAGGGPGPGAGAGASALRPAGLPELTAFASEVLQSKALKTHLAAVAGKWSSGVARRRAQARCCPR